MAKLLLVFKKMQRKFAMAVLILFGFPLLFSINCQLCRDPRGKDLLPNCITLPQGSVSNLEVL